MCRAAAIVLFWLLGAALGYASASQSMGVAPRIAWGSCPQDSAGSAVSGARTQCGWLFTGKAIDDRPVRLRVVVLRARPDRDSRWPLIYIPGGPGDAAGLDGFALVRWRRFQQRAGWPRDIVLFDPRGTGLSRPRIACRDRPDTRFRPPQLLLDCTPANASFLRDSLGPVTQTVDIAHLLDALHVARADLWGVSYGTRIARTFAAQFPTRVHALILDSLVTTSGSASADRRTAVVGAVNALMASCHQMLACRLRVPSLASALAGTLGAYHQRAPVATGADVPRRGWSVVLTPQRLLSALALASYRPATAADNRSRLQLVARSGDVRALSPLVAGLVRTIDDPRHSRLVFDVTRCAYARRQGDTPLPNGTPVWLGFYLRTHDGRDCSWSGTGRTDPDPPWPRRPTLILDGLADPVTPIRSIATITSRRPWIIGVSIPQAGHAPTLDNRCAQQVVAGFMSATGITAALPRCAVLAEAEVPYRQRLR